MRIVLTILFFVFGTSFSNASTTLTLLCEGELQYFGERLRISTVITIQDDKFKSKDTLNREYGGLLTSGKATFTESEIWLYDSGINKINRTSGQFIFAKELQGPRSNVDIKCEPQKKLF